MMLVNTSDVLLRLFLIKHSDLAHILIIHMKHSNSVSAAVSSKHMHLHRHTGLQYSYQSWHKPLLKVSLCSQPVKFTDEDHDAKQKKNTGKSLKTKPVKMNCA